MLVMLCVGCRCLLSGTYQNTCASPGCIIWSGPSKMQLQRGRISPQIPLWGQGQWLVRGEGAPLELTPLEQSPPHSSLLLFLFVARGRRTPFERRSLTGAVCRVIFPDEVLLQLCNTCFIYLTPYTSGFSWSSWLDFSNRECSI